MNEKYSIKIAIIYTDSNNLIQQGKYHIDNLNEYDFEKIKADPFGSIYLLLIEKGIDIKELIYNQHAIYKVNEIDENYRTETLFPIHEFKFYNPFYYNKNIDKIINDGLKKLNKMEYQEL